MLLINIIMLSSNASFNKNLSLKKIKKLSGIISNIPDNNIVLPYIK